MALGMTVALSFYVVEGVLFNSTMSPAQEQSTAAPFGTSLGLFFVAEQPWSVTFRRVLTIAAVGCNSGPRSLIYSPALPAVLSVRCCSTGLSLYAKHSAWVLGREQTAMKAKITAEEKIVSADFTFEGKRGI